jgi:FkbM family methyltransferase
MLSMSLIRQAIKNFLLKKNAILSRPPGQFVITPLRIKKARDRGLKINFVIDGGAAKGSFAEEILEVYPQAKVLCIEPRDESMAGLRQVAQQFPNITIAQTLIGDHDGEVTFNVHADQSSIFTEYNKELGKKVTAKMTTIDQLVQSNNHPWPDMIKLDLQGAELQALSGATECLKHCQMVIMEVSFIPLMKGWPLIGEVIPFMTERGFVCYDIAGLWQRPLDGALAQGDFFFLRKDHELLKDTRWNNRGDWGPG